MDFKGTMLSGPVLAWLVIYIKK